MGFEYADKYVNEIEDITEGCWLIFKNSSYYTPGDERSRTNPGHGYPESTTKYLQIERYDTEHKFKAALEVCFEKREKVLGVKLGASYKAKAIFIVEENGKT